MKHDASPIAIIADVHGNADALTAVLADIAAQGIQRILNLSDRVGQRPRAEIEAEADGIAATLILCGHTHLQRRVDLPDGRIILNPGSVGCPAYRDDKPVPHVMQTGSADAAYAVVRRGDGWSSSFHRVPCDSARMAAPARKAGRDDWVHAL